MDADSWGRKQTWEEICEDPSLADLPYRVESDKWGNIVLSPLPGADHAGYQGEIIARLSRLMPHGRALGECPIRTKEGVKGADAAWISRARAKQRPSSSIVFLLAPEICVEVRSPSNTYREIMEKLDLYFDKDAKECWMCDGTGYVTFFGINGQLSSSELCPEFPTKITLDA